MQRSLKDTRARAKRAVETIVNDLSDRRGLRGAWDSIDDERQDEIMKVWEHYVVEAFGEEES